MKVLQRNGKRGELLKSFESRLDFFRDELENVFERTWRAFQTEPFMPLKTWQQWPPLDVIEDEQGLMIEVEVPGFGPEDLEVEVEGKLLIIRGIFDEKQVQVPEKKLRYERHVENFKRIIAIPEYFNPEKIEAKYDKGTLVIRLPWLPGRTPKKVLIKTV